MMSASSSATTALPRLKELFSGYDDEFLTSIYSQCGNDLNRAVDKLLEIANDPSARRRMENGDDKMQVERTSDDSRKALDILSQAALSAHHRDKESTPPPQPPPSTDMGPLHPAVVEMKKLQLQQVMRYLVTNGLAGMSPEERRNYLAHNPQAVSSLKAFLTSIGLGNMNFSQLPQYFKESGLNFGIPPATTPNQRDPLVRQVLTVETRTYEQYQFNTALNYTQKRQFFDYGFLSIQGVVPKAFCDAAVRDINRCIGQGYTREQRTMFEISTWCPEIASAPSILDLLYRTPALAVAMSLVGPIARIMAGHISVRFPGAGCIDRDDERIRPLLQPHQPINHYVPNPTWPQNWQIDNLHTPFNSVPRNQARNYTLLVAILLSDTPATLSGNLTVYPGTHHAIQNVFRQAGGSQAFLDRFGLDELRRRVPVPEGVQVVGNAGDVILCHYSTANTIAPNVSPNVRYMVLFKLYHASHVPGIFRPDSMDDIWLEYDGMRDIRSAAVVPNAVPVATSKRCPHCASTMEMTARFCAYCGAALQ